MPLAVSRFAVALPESVIVLLTTAGLVRNTLSAAVGTADPLQFDEVAQRPLVAPVQAVSAADTNEVEARAKAATRAAITSRLWRASMTAGFLRREAV